MEINPFISKNILGSGVHFENVLCDILHDRFIDFPNRMHSNKHSQLWMMPTLSNISFE